MRSRVIPAQITTVEDKIAGNLNLTQILILMVPVFWTAVVYTLLLPAMHLTFYKVLLIISVLFLCLLLSLRIKGKVVFNWLLTILTFNLRPKYFVFNKNDTTTRVVDLPVFEKKPRTLFRKTTSKDKVKLAIPHVDIKGLMHLERLVKNPKGNLSFKTGKGGLYVAFHEIQP